MDRNNLTKARTTKKSPSLSARRAWIEIINEDEAKNCRTVALRKESVDRNARASFLTCLYGSVALRKESVDRNYENMQTPMKDVVSLSARRAWIEIALIYSDLRLPSRRSPQGERG